MRRDVSADFCASAVLVLRSGSDFILPFTRSVMARPGPSQYLTVWDIGGMPPEGSRLAPRGSKTAPTRPKPIVKLLDMAYKEARFSLSPS